MIVFFVIVSICLIGWTRANVNPCFLRLHKWSDEVWWTKTHHMGLDPKKKELVSFSIRHAHCNRCEATKAMDVIARTIE